MDFVKTFLAVASAIIITGIVLDEIGQGRLGTSAQMIALKATHGYGAGA